MSDVILLGDFDSNQIGPEDAVIFGGTFDPVHEGHVADIRKLIELFPQVIVAPTPANPWKDAPAASFTDRLEMIRLVLKAELIPFAEAIGGAQVALVAEGYRFSFELVAALRPRVKGALYWAVAEDAASTVSQWKEWSTKGVPVIVLPLHGQFHAADVRAGTAELHPALRDYVEARGFYARQRK